MNRYRRELHDALLTAGLIVLLAACALAVAATAGCASAPDSPGDSANAPADAPPGGWDDPGPYSPVGGNDPNPNTAEGPGDGRTVQPPAEEPAWLTDARIAIHEALAVVPSQSIAEALLRSALLALEDVPPSAERADRHLADAVLASSGRDGEAAVRAAKAAVARELVRREMAR